MSVSGDDVAEETNSVSNFCNDEASFSPQENTCSEESEVIKEENLKTEGRFAHTPRPPRPRYHNPSMGFRHGNRPSFSPGFRGPRMPMHMTGNPGPGFMRPVMGPNRNGPPFDGYGPPGMGMNRGPPPRHPQHFAPRFNPGPECQYDEEVDDFREMNHDYNMPPNPNVRPRGPPPFMMGAPGGPHPGPPHNIPSGGPPPGPPGGPFQGHPGPQFGGGPPFNSHGPPNPVGPPFTSAGPPFVNGNSGRPFPCPPCPGPNMGNPGNRDPSFGGQGMNNPEAQDFSGSSCPGFGPPFPGGPPNHFPPRPPFAMSQGSPAPPSMPPGLPSNAGHPPPNPPSGPLLPPPNMPPAPQCPVAPHGNPLPQPPFTGPGDHSNQPPFSGPAPPFAPVRPPANFQTGPPPPVSSPATVHSSTSAPAPISVPPNTVQSSPALQYPGAPPTSDGSPFAMPPGYQTTLPAAPRPMMVPQSVGAASVPLHMMPPPMQAMPVAPPAIPAFRPPMPFIPPAIPVTPVATNTPTISQLKPPEDIWVENSTAEGKSYYYNMRTRETRWDKPDNVTVVRQGEVESATKPVSFTLAPTGPTQQMTLQKPPEVAAWSEYRNQEGFQSKVPAPPVQQTIAVTKSPVVQPISSVEEKTKESSITVAPEARVVIAKSDSETIATTTKANSVTPESTSEAKDQSKTPRDNSKPVSSTPVPGTPWCVVWTGDDRAFFYNPSQRLSVWEKPDELKGRVDVDRLLEKQPDAVPKTEAVVSDKSSSDNHVDGESEAKKPRMDEDLNPPPTAEADSKAMEVDAEPEKPNDKIPVGMEAAREAEERAARERATQPLELRVRRFRELLVEKQVSAFSTWEKELHKIVFDPRYLLLTSKERRQTFETYVKERAEDERREKKNKIKERRDKFLELLEEANLTSKSTFSDFSSKHSKDERFKAIEKSRDRETLFQDYMADLRKREKDDKFREKDDKQREKKRKSDFLELLREQKGISRHSHWSDVKRKIDNDPRYKAIETSSRREDLFRDFLKKLDESSPYREDSGSKRDRERKERQEASLREREREVKEALSSSLKEREAEREQQLLIEQRQNFQAMLAELIRDPSISWKEAKKILRKDTRWELASDVLQRTERDRIFEEHLDNLSRKLRDMKALSDSHSKEKRLNNDVDSRNDNSLHDGDRKSAISSRDGDRR